MQLVRAVNGLPAAAAAGNMDDMIKGLAAVKGFVKAMNISVTTVNGAGRAANNSINANTDAI